MKKLLLCGLSAVLLAIDLVTKYAAATLDERIQVIPNFFYIRFFKNFGSAWSLFEGFGPVVIVISIVVAGVLIYYFIKENDPWILTAIALGFAGNLGNLYDRVTLGYVRDMLSFNLFGYWFPVFNIADACMVIGVGIVFVHAYFKEREVRSND